MERDIRRITDTSLETGLKGILAYVHSRLMSERGTSYVPFDDIYLAEVNKIKSKLCIPIESIELSYIWKHCITIFKSNRNTPWKKGISILYGYE